MASEAKIGLLLGLVIIFAVAFVINGLPRFGNTNKSNDLKNVVEQGPDGIRPDVSREAFVHGQSPAPVPTVTATDPGENEHSGDLPSPKIPAVDVAERRVTEVPEPKNDPTESAKVVQPKPVQPAWPKIHVVRKGDNLADIAKIYYGPKEGNRIANVMRIFESNKNMLKSPDKIFPGQRLIIPSLWASGLDAKTILRIFPDSMFERVGSIGRRHL